MTFRVPERARITEGQFATTTVDGCNGLFRFRGPDPHRSMLAVIASDGGGWEHVGVSLPGRMPSWDEMCSVRDVFWSPDVAVMQLHPTRNNYVNNHPYCLHLWRPVDGAIPLPPSFMVGLAGVDPQQFAKLIGSRA